MTIPCSDDQKVSYVCLPLNPIGGRRFSYTVMPHRIACFIHAPLCLIVVAVRAWILPFSPTGRSFVLVRDGLQLCMSGSLMSPDYVSCWLSTCFSLLFNDELYLTSDLQD